MGVFVGAACSLHWVTLQETLREMLTRNVRTNRKQFQDGESRTRKRNREYWPYQRKIDIPSWYWMSTHQPEAEKIVLRDLYNITKAPCSQAPTCYTLSTRGPRHHSARLYV